MTEIKSTLKLALERASKFSITSEDRERAKVEEYTKKISGLLNRFFDSRIRLDEFKREIGKLTDNKNDMVRKIIVSNMADRLQLENENQRIFDLLKVIDESIDDSLFIDIKKLTKNYKKELEKIAGIFKGKMLKELEKEGIRGTSIVPNINGNSGRIDAKDDLKSKFESNLCGLREKLIETALHK